MPSISPDITPAAALTPPQAMIPFSRPHLTGNEIRYIQQAMATGKLSGNGLFTQKCERFFESRYGFSRALLTPSCTDALEMTALLMDLKPGDEVILPSFTFVSTANAYALRGATLVFADSEATTPNLDVNQLEALITPRTRAIICVHYGGMACDMARLKQLADQYQLFLVEDCAHVIDGFYHGQPLGTFGQFATFSFHETKNICAGEGGLLAINDPAYTARAEIIREKGTDRSAFFRGEVDKYNWQAVGSSFLAPEIVAAFLWAQLEQLETIQTKRHQLWARYYQQLCLPGLIPFFTLPQVPPGVAHSAHVFYGLCPSGAERDALIAHLKARQVQATFHYLPLERSPYFASQHDGRSLTHATRYADTLIRLPLYYDLTLDEVDYISEQIITFFS
jgi:dTDP-4-amino-4,6-dideoxygalactose transaminase